MLKTIRLFRLTLLEFRIKRLQAKKFKLSLKFENGIDSIPQENLSQLNDVLSHLKNSFSFVPDYCEVNDEE